MVVIVVAAVQLVHTRDHRWHHWHYRTLRVPRRLVPQCGLTLLLPHFLRQHPRCHPRHLGNLLGVVASRTLATPVS